MQPIGLVLFPLIFLLGMFLITALGSAFRTMRHRRSKEALGKTGNLFFYAPIQDWFFPEKPFEMLYLATIFAQNLNRFGFAATSIAGLFMLQVLPVDGASLETWGTFFSYWGGTLGLILALLVASLLVGDLIPRNLGTQYPEQVVRVCAPPAALYLTTLFPVSYTFLKLAQSLAQNARLEKIDEPLSQVSEKVIEMIQDATVHMKMDPEHKKLIESAITFRDRIVREVMVPRVNVFCLPSDTTIRKAAAKLMEEGYSRVPIYRGNIDNIIGILMYKDLLEIYMTCMEKQDFTQLDVPVEMIVKEVLYTPETKKISHMLQEFRRKQLHLAIVVDEYGGTEGVVTIEDILEEIVGEIEDEYDEEEDKLFLAQVDGGWIVDASMSLLDIEEKLDLKIPHEGNYDTLAGYLFHRAGAIPSKGMIIHHDDFDLEILSSDERRIKKVRITPLAC